MELKLALQASCYGDIMVYYIVCQRVMPNQNIESIVVQMCAAERDPSHCLHLFSPGLQGGLVTLIALLNKSWDLLF